MQCCGTKSNINLDSLLQKIREPKPNISTRLNGCQIDYNTKPCKWKTNFHELVPAEDQQYQRRLNELRRKCEEKDKEIDELERKYLAKIVDLLILTQVHCEIKTDINKTFDDLGISIKEVEKERWIEEDENSQYKQNINDGASYQSFKNNE